MTHSLTAIIVSGTFPIDTGGLTAPANFNAVGGDTVANLSWNSVVDATDYEVRVDAGSWISTSNATTYQFTSLTNDQSYTFDVRATNVSEDGPSSTDTATPVEASTSTITGTGFGTNTATQHFSKDWLDALPDGAAPEANGWTWAGYDVDVDTDPTYGKILSGITNSTDFNNPRQYNHGLDIPASSDMFVSWVSRLTIPDSNLDFQHKQFRVEPTVNYVDGGPEITEFNWFGGAGKQMGFRPTSATSGPTEYGQPYQDKDTWTRQERSYEIAAQGSSTSDVNVARFPYGSAPTFKLNASQLLYNDSDRYQAFIWQNYVGNTSNGTRSDETHEGKDYYVQIDSKKNVILSTHTDPALATFTQVQKWNSWSDTSIDFDVNLTGVADGSYYILVRDGLETVLGSEARTVSGGVFV